MRVVLDTNVLVSAFATRGLCSDVLRIVLADHQLLLSDVILREFRQILAEMIGAPATAIAAAEEVIRAGTHVQGPLSPPRSLFVTRPTAGSWQRQSSEPRTSWSPAIGTCWSSLRGPTFGS